MNSAIDSVRLKIGTGFVSFTEKGVSTLVNMKGTAYVNGQVASEATMLAQIVKEK